MSKELFISSSPHETKVAVLEHDLLVEVYYERDTDAGLVGGIYKGRVNRVLPGMQSAFVDIGLERDAFLYVSDFFLEDQEEYDKVFEEAEVNASRLTTEEARVAEAKPGPAGAALSEAAPAPAPVAAALGPETAPRPYSVPGAGPVAPEPTPAEATVASRTPGATEAGERSTAPFVPGPVAPGTTSAPFSSSGPSRPPSVPRYAGERGGSGRDRDYRGRRRRGGRGDRGGFGRPKFPERKFVPRTEEQGPHSFEILPGESLAKYSHPPASPAAPEAVEAGVHESTSAAPSEAANYPAEPMRPAFREAEAAPLEIQKVHEAPEYPPASEALAGLPELERTALPEEGEEDGALDESGALAKSFETPLSSAPLPETGAGAPLEAAPPLVGAGASLEASAAPAGEAEAGAVSGPASQELSERTYTMREPYQRPHYAPRRGPRGRRGGRRFQGGRPERSPRGLNGGQTPQISQLLKEGQEILVQIAKEPLGTKGARITSHIALPGRYLVFMPTIDHIGVSRKIASEQERLRLRNLILENKGPLNGGFIVRTAGDGRSDEELKADLRFLSTLWADIKGRSERSKAPALIHRDLSLVQRVLRDTLTPDFKSVRVDNEAEYERVVDFISRCQPSLTGHVKLYTRDTPLFEEFGVEQEIEKALKPKVWLKSGGYIVINQTEALVAIDVNTGKYVGKTNRLEDTILKTNVDAVNEIVRQIRLRDLGGIIVIDFIDMDERRNRMKVVQVLEEALRHDRAPTKVTAFHDFGLVAITRKRVKQSLERTLCQPCEYCSGAGWVKSVTSVCYAILAEARKMAKQIDGDTITLRVSPEVARGLKSRDGVLIAEIESITHKDVVIKSDPTVHQERFEIF